MWLSHFNPSGHLNSAKNINFIVNSHQYNITEVTKPISNCVFSPQGSQSVSELFLAFAHDNYTIDIVIKIYI